MEKRVIIIGGGITGLSAGCYLHNREATSNKAIATPSACTNCVSKQKRVAGTSPSKSILTKLDD